MRVIACVMALVMYYAPAVFLADQVAHAAPIVDPRAPLAFQPAITQTSTGVPAVNIAAPNANGVSMNQYQSFNVDAAGLVLNNSTMAGTPLLGGTLGANPNLGGRSASLIINQITATGPASTLAGPLEVFGAPAAVVIASPNGLSVNGLSVTNVTNLTLTTGTPQFLTGIGGSATSFANAAAVAYNVSSGNITIDGPAGNDGTPGAGIEGTVGNLDLIGQTVDIDAPLYSNQRVNVITGNQLVTPGASDSTGLTYSTASNGLPDNAAAMAGANGQAIDASQYGSITSGEIYIVQNASGLGANMQGPLSATAGNVVVSSNGDIAVGSTYAAQNASLTSAGSAAIAGTGLANQNYTVNAGGDIAATGAISAGQGATLTAGGTLNAASVAANGNATLSAGDAMTVGSVSGQNLALQAASGDLTVGSALTAPGTIVATAGADLTVNGAVQGGSTVSLTGGGNASVNGAVSGVGDTTIAAQGGSASVSGNAQSNGALTIDAAQNVAIGGAAGAQGPVSITAQAGSITGQGDVDSAQDAVNLQAGQAIQLGGSVAAGTSVSANAGGAVSMSGTVSAPGAVSIQSGADTTLGGNVTSGSTLAVAAGGNATLDGLAASVGDMTLAAGNTLATTGQITSLGAFGATGQQGVNLGGTVYSGGNAQIGSAAGGVTLAGAVSSPGSVSVSAGQDATVSGSVHSGTDTTITAGRDANLNGALEADGTGNASVTAGRDINGTGALDVANNTTLVAGNDVAVSGAIQTGNNLGVTAGNTLSLGATTAVGTSTLSATSGSVTLTGAALSGGTTTIAAGTDVDAQGNVRSLGDLDVSATSGSLTASGTMSASGDLTLAADQNLTLNAQTTASQNATLRAANITTQGLAVGGNLSATATNDLDTSAGQLDAAFSASAPSLSVTGDATLQGANVTTANAVIGGAYSATGTTSLTTGGTAAYRAGAALAGGTVYNVGSQMAAGDLTVSGSTVTNAGGLSSLQTLSVAAANLDNTGTIYAPTADLTIAGGTTNAGSLLATNTLALTTNSLNNANGLIFAGDVNNPAAATGNASVTVTGGNGSFNNAAGQILAQNVATLNLPNQALDPSASSYGTVNGGNGLNLSVQSLANSGTWTLPGTAVSVSASAGIGNTGTITQGSGTLALNGAVTNGGTISAEDLTINGSLANQAGAKVTANDAFTLDGAGTNAGTVEALNTLTISGPSYDNANGTTKAGDGASGSGNATLTLSGALTNAGGTLSATNDLTVTAGSVDNSAASGTATTTTTTTVVNTPLIMALNVGSDTLDDFNLEGAENGFCCSVEQTAQTVTLADALAPTGTTSSAYLQTSQPVATSGSVTFVLVPTVTGTDNNGNNVVQDLWFVETPQNANMAISTKTVALPSVTETTTTTGAQLGAGSVIAAGNTLDLSAGSVDNTGGTVSAGNDVNLNVQSLSNGGSTDSSTVTDSIDPGSINNFLSQAPSTISIWDDYNGSSPLGPYAVGYYIDGGGIALDAPGSVAPLSVSSSVTVQGTTGQIVAGHNLNLSGGNLTNAGSLMAGNDVNIAAASFTNQGVNTGTMTTTAGCAPGFSAGCASLSTTNPNSQTYGYQQTNATVTADNDVVIAAGSVSNTYGNLVAGRNVVIGGAGSAGSDASTTPAALTQAGSVTNTSGAIEAGNDVDIDAATLTNSIAAPAQVHQNYGSATPYTGCTNNCEAYVDVQSANPGTITANHDVNLTASAFSNTGSLVTALNSVAIDAGGSASNNNQYLYAYWSSGFTRYGTQYATWGCANDTTLCAQLYGGNYSASAPQDPAGLPDAVGLPDFVAGTIQAGNALSVHSPTLANTGNVIGQSVSLSGATLVNGLTNPHVYTPPPAQSGQVISLGPPSVPPGATTTVNSAGLVTTLSGQPTSVTGAAGLPSYTPIGVQTVGKPVAPSVPTAGTPDSTTVQTPAGQSVTVKYLTNSPAAQVVNALSPASLVASLPANLQPGNVPFYYDPYTQAQQVEQAALEATGQSSFYSTTSATDSASQTSINNQDTDELYGAAVQYAEKNNVALGTQLSQAQLALVNQPMLWYVQETVPEPGCTATGNGACPTEQALVPEVLLPQNYASVNADGEISGSNVTLNYSDSVLNTGSVSAQNLTVDTGTLTNEQRSTNVGTIYQQLSEGVAATTGTVVQQGGFMSAANYDLQVQSLDQIGGALAVTNADGTENAAATQAMLASLKDQLGGQFAQSTVSDDLQTAMVATDSGGLGMELFAMAAAVVAAIALQPEISAAIGSLAGATAGAGTLMAAAGSGAGALGAGLGNLALSVGLTAMTSSSLTQFMTTGTVNLGSAFETGLVSGLTAGLLNGITYNSGSGFGFSTVPSQSSLAALAGVEPSAGNSVVSTASATMARLPTQALAIAGEATIQASVQEAIEGGSFLRALEDSAVSDVSAAAAYDVGTAFDGTNPTLGTAGPTNPLYVLSHAALGCASSAALGTGCAGGAIGGATSAALSSWVVQQIDPAHTPLDQGQTAAVTALAMLAGGGLAGALNQNATGAANAAENEALNNATKHPGQVLDTWAMTPQEEEEYEDTQTDVLTPAPNSAATETASGGEEVTGAAPPLGNGTSPSGDATNGGSQSVESLFGQTLNGSSLSHTAGLQNGVLGEAVGLQTLEQETGLTFSPLQNNSGNGADGVAIDPNTQTIWVAEVKSSQNGVNAAATAQGDPATKLDAWLNLSTNPSGTSWAAQPSSNQALTQSIQNAIDSGYQIKGVQVQVGVPAPGATGTTQIAIQPWLPK
jgi:filamentous hemagglutinin